MRVLNVLGISFHWYRLTSIDLCLLLFNKNSFIFDIYTSMYQRIILAWLLHDLIGVIIVRNCFAATEI